MKSSLLVYSLGLVAAALGFAADFVSAPTYNAAFVATALFCALSIACLGYLVFRNHSWFLPALIPLLLAIYALTDMVLRCVWGVRLLDIFR